MLAYKAFTHPIQIRVFSKFQKMAHFTGWYLEGEKSLRDFYFCLQITYNGTLLIERIRHVGVVGFWQSIFKNWGNSAVCTIFQK